MAAPLRVAVAGAGSFGRNHLRVYRELETADAGVVLAAALEPDPARAAEVAAKYAIPVFESAEKLLAAGLKLDAADVAVPTVHHYAVATELLAGGLDLLIEKPIAASIAQADEIIALAEKHQRVVQVGHLERFNPAITTVEPRLRRPMFFESHRLSIFTPRALDVDVVLDLMIHDLDIVLHFAHSEVREVRAVGLPILSPKVDIANVRVEFDSGCVANFTASRVSTERVRKLRFFEPRQYVSVDYARQDLLVIGVDQKVPPEVAAAIASGQLSAPALAQLAEKFGHKASDGPESALGPGLSFDRPAVTAGEPLKLEMLSFLDAVRTRQAPRVTARQGRDALALALTIQSSMAEHANRAGLHNFFLPTA